VFTFSCPKAVKEEWVQVAHEMMAGVRVR
jgi:hypothetical protein